MAKERKKLITPPFTANFAQQLFKAKSTGDSDPCYSVVMVLPADHPFWEKIRKDIKAAYVKKFDKVPPSTKIAHNGKPIRDADEVEWIKQEDSLFVTLKRKEDDGKPEIIDADKEDIIDMSEIYSGMICRASFNAGAWKYESKYGTSLYLNNVQKLGDGPPIGRVTSKAVDDFETYVDDDDDDDDEDGEDLLG